MTDYIYLPVPIEDKPKETGWYDFPGDTVVKAMSLYWDAEEHEWHDYPGQDESTYEPIDHTHYLRKVPRQEYDRERMIGFAEWIFIKGYYWNEDKKGWRHLEDAHTFHTTADLLQTYLETL